MCSNEFIAVTDRIVTGGVAAAFALLLWLLSVDWKPDVFLLCTTGLAAASVVFLGAAYVAVEIVKYRKLNASPYDRLLTFSFCFGSIALLAALLCIVLIKSFFVAVILVTSFSTVLIVLWLFERKS